MDSVDGRSTELNPKQEKFCQIYVEIGNASEAYKQAYNSKAKHESRAVEACKLLKKPNIALRVKTLREETEQISSWSRLDSIRVLSEIAKGHDEEAKPNDRVNAVKALNTMHGWDKQTIDHTNSDGSMAPPSRIEIVAPNDSQED